MAREILRVSEAHGGASRALNGTGGGSHLRKRPGSALKLGGIASAFVRQGPQAGADFGGHVRAVRRIIWLR